jgi:hypothetical protein
MPHAKLQWLIIYPLQTEKQGQIRVDFSFFFYTYGNITLK